MMEEVLHSFSNMPGSKESNEVEILEICKAMKSSIDGFSENLIIEGDSKVQKCDEVR